MASAQLLRKLDRGGRIHWEEEMADGTFSSAKKGASASQDEERQGHKMMVLVDGSGLPLGAEIASESPHEVTLIEPLLDRRILARSRID